MATVTGTEVRLGFLRNTPVYEPLFAGIKKKMHFRGEMKPRSAGSDWPIKDSCGPAGTNEHFAARLHICGICGGVFAALYAEMSAAPPARAGSWFRRFFWSRLWSLQLPAGAQTPPSSARTYLSVFAELSEPSSSEPLCGPN